MATGIIGNNGIQSVFVMQGGLVEYVKQDDSSRKWMNEFRSKSYAKPISFEAVEGLLMDTCCIAVSCVLMYFCFRLYTRYFWPLDAYFFYLNL